MANTYSQIYIHTVFAVKGRKILIEKNWRDGLYKYICGIVNNKNQKIYAINGVADHIHILLSIKPNIILSDLIRDIKASSTRYVNINALVNGKFQWQEGFESFSVSQSQIDKVIAYIDHQDIHHQKLTFKQEYIDFLKSYKIDYDEKYIFDFIE
jgi:REP element-mobilizing transposase RayT